MGCSLFAVATGVVLANLAGAAAAASYTYQVFAVPGAVSTIGFSINARGEVVGNYRIRSGPIKDTQHVFSYSGGQFQTIEPAGSTYASAVGLANNGMVTGVCKGATKVYQSYMCRNGVCTIYAQTGRNMEFQATSRNGLTLGVVQSYDFSSLGGLFEVRQGHEIRLVDLRSDASNFTMGINNTGAFTGGYSGSEGPYQLGYVVKNGIPREISIPGGTKIAPYGINDEGLVAGVYTDSATRGFAGFTDLNGVVQEIRDPDGVQTVVYNLNDAGDLIGSTYDVSGVGHPFVLHAGVFTTLQPNSSPGDQGYVSSINDAGQILGYYMNSDRVYVSYIATPSF